MHYIFNFYIKILVELDIVENVIGIEGARFISEALGHNTVAYDKNFDYRFIYSF